MGGIHGFFHSSSGVRSYESHRSEFYGLNMNTFEPVDLAQKIAEIRPNDRSAAFYAASLPKSEGTELLIAKFCREKKRRKRRPPLFCAGLAQFQTRQNAVLFAR
jgi:hypothetical protein